MNDLGKVLTIFITVGSIGFGILAYYITSEDEKLRLGMETRLLVLETNQKRTRDLEALVFRIDKQLNNIESEMVRQSELHEDITDKLQLLRNDVTALKVAIAGHPIAMLGMSP